MKIKTPLLFLGVAAVAFGLAASARATLTYSSDDLILGFYSTNSSESLVVNLGQASTYRDATSAFDLTSVGSIKADLVATFGEDWNTQADLKWGVFGTTYNAAVGADGAWTLYATRVEDPVGNTAQAYNLGGVNTQSIPAGKIAAIGQAYAQGTAANNSKATVEDSSIPNDFAEQQTSNGQVSFGYFNGALANFGNGTAGSALDLFRLQTGSSSGQGTLEGTFTISDDGILRFTAVPEPSVLALLGLTAVGGAVAFARRRQLSAKA